MWRLCYHAKVAKNHPKIQKLILFLNHMNYLFKFFIYDTTQNLVSTVETLTWQIECLDSKRARVQSFSLSKPYKCCSMLCEVFFSLFVRLLWDCALSCSFATSNFKPIWNSVKFLREGHIHTKDSSTSPFFCYSTSQSCPCFYNDPQSTHITRKKNTPKIQQTKKVRKLYQITINNPTLSF